MTPCPVVTTYHLTRVIYRHILHQHRCDNPKCILAVYAKALSVSQTTVILLKNEMARMYMEAVVA